MTPHSTPVPAAFSWKGPRQPMLWACIAYGCGIVAGIYEWRPVSWWILAATGFIISASYFLRRRVGLGWVLALGTFFLAGAFHGQVRSGSERLDTSIQPFADRQPVEVIAHVIKSGRLRQDGPE